jgi:hypothetical protein
MSKVRTREWKQVARVHEWVKQISTSQRKAMVDASEQIPQSWKISSLLFFRDFGTCTRWLVWAHLGSCYALFTALTTWYGKLAQTKKLWIRPDMQCPYLKHLVQCQAYVHNQGLSIAYLSEFKFKIHKTVQCRPRHGCYIWLLIDVIKNPICPDM